MRDDSAGVVMEVTGRRAEAEGRRPAHVGFEREDLCKVEIKRSMAIERVGARALMGRGGKEMFGAGNGGGRAARFGSLCFVVTLLKRASDWIAAHHTD